VTLPLSSLRGELAALLGQERVCADAPLAPLTTFRIGGPADLLAEARGADELARVVECAFAHGVPLTLLGGGSNVLVADAGVRGLVVRAHGGRIERTAEGVRADAGVTINGLVRFTVQRGLGGLAAWAGTPGTVGGAISGNAHFDGRVIGERVARVQRTGEVLLWADFRVEPDDPGVLRDTARRSLAFRKRTQPLAQPSAGCIFRNPDRVPPGLPASAGALIDAAGLKGLRAGGARISPVHANFFVNEGGARARDVAELIERAKDVVKSRFGISLCEEIVRLGEF
jgi:UDP-N-acetylmuramate dehydrogenase